MRNDYLLCSAFWRLKKVTTGLVKDEEIALPAISRRSPLAPWKMLIKALACFYRHEDEICERYLQAVDPESAPARLVPLIRRMVAGKSNGNLAGSSVLLVEKVTGNSKKIRHAFQTLDSSLAGKKPHNLFEATRNAVIICEQSCPELIDRLKQHISIRSWMNEDDVEDVTGALGGPSLKNAYFWRLHARAAEIKGKNLSACALWEEFRKHALHEKWFSEKDKEVSVIYLHMADLLRGLGAGGLEWHRRDFERRFRGFEPYYHEQPRSVLEAGHKHRNGASDTYFLYPEHLYSLARKIDPSSETFRQWLDWLENDDSHWKEANAAAKAWHAAVPDDARPLLFLMKSAEKRNSLKKALGYLEKAERLDGLNPGVKRARLHLLAATAIRHLKQKKTRLARKDLVEIDALPQSGEGDQPAFLVALKSVCAMIDREKSRSDRLNEKLIKLLENKLTAKVFMEGLLTVCGLPDQATHFRSYEKEPLEGDDLVAAVARGCKLGDDMGVPVAIPGEYEEKISDFFTTKECSLDTAAIRIIGEAALRNKNLKLAYAAAGAGLLRGGAAAARFLLLRARSLPTWEMTRRDACITAAIELARRERDMNLIDEAIELHRDGKGSQYGLSIRNDMMGKSNFSMEAQELNEVLRCEKEAREYPSSTPMNLLNSFDYDEDDDLEAHDCENCDVKNCSGRKAAYVPDNFSNYDFDDDDYFPNLPPGVVSLLIEEIAKNGRKHGRTPDLKELARKKPKLVEQMVQILLDSKADGNLPDLDRDWFPGTSRRSRHSRRNR
jgi:hypothetical protein